MAIHKEGRVVFGETLVDFSANPAIPTTDVERYTAHPGGAAFNTAYGLGKLGVPTTLISCVGRDKFGQILIDKLREVNVDTENIIIDPDSVTSMAFVSVEPATGERSFQFFPGAHANVKPSLVTLPRNTGILHFGGVLQATDRSRRTTETLIRHAHKVNSVLSYDPNVRPELWQSEGHAIDAALATIPKVDILKVSESEAQLLTGLSDPILAAEALYKPNLDAIFVTLGERGAYVRTRNLRIEVPVPIRVNPVDTTGAGDAFNAGILMALHESRSLFSDMSKIRLRDAVQVANYLGAKATTAHGAITAAVSWIDLAIARHDASYLD